MNIVNQATHSLLSLSTGIVVIIVLSILFTAHAFMRGKGKGVSLVLSFYPAILVYGYIPFSQFHANTMIEAVAFGFLVVAIYFILNRFIEGGFDFAPTRKFFSSLILGLLSTILVLWATYHIAAIAAIDPVNFSQNVDAVFAAKYSLSILALPLVAIFFI